MSTNNTAANRAAAMQLIAQIEQLVHGQPWPAAECALTVILGKLITNVPEAKQLQVREMVCQHIVGAHQSALLIAEGADSMEGH